MFTQINAGSNYKVISLLYASKPSKQSRKLYIFNGSWNDVINESIFDFDCANFSFTFFYYIVILSGDS